ncbi:hypothetical protein [Afifella marina]|uniref:hypothetical protein n=1 Tax=Afifella marina TaxID=1080 RepID=UPI001113427B|nr:hypothetical protein [Afifella marina]
MPDADFSGPGFGVPLLTSLSALLAAPVSVPVLGIAPGLPVAVPVAAVPVAVAPAVPAALVLEAFLPAAPGAVVLLSGLAGSLSDVLSEVAEVLSGVAFSAVLADVEGFSPAFAVAALDAAAALPFAAASVPLAFVALALSAPRLAAPVFTASSRCAFLSSDGFTGPAGAPVFPGSSWRPSRSTAIFGASFFLGSAGPPAELCFTSSAFRSIVTGLRLSPEADIRLSSGCLATCPSCS